MAVQDPNAFRAKYVNAGGDLQGLRQRLATFCKRTLRKQVLEYVRYARLAQAAAREI